MRPGCIGLWKRVLKFDRPEGRRVLKFDGLSGRGLWIALRAILIKSALRIYLSVSYDMISTTIMSHLRWLPPFGALRHHLPPAERWDYKDLKGSLLIVDSTVLLYRWRQPPKRGDAFSRPKGGCKGFIQTGAFYKFRGAHNNPQRQSRCQT